MLDKVAIKAAIMNDFFAILNQPPTWVFWVFVYLVLQRLGELVYARRNTKRLLSEGAKEFGARHYHYFILLHGSWLLVMMALVKPEHDLNPYLLNAFFLSQIIRFWTLASIGRWWTTRIISAPHFPRVKKGPYKFISHPNYTVVILEIAIVPILFGLWWVAILFSVLNAILLRHRIAIENMVLRERD